MSDVKNNEKTQRFEIERNGLVAFLEYGLEDGAIVLEHTKVPDGLAGQGIASTLAEAGFDYARSNHLKVVVICPFVAKWLERHPEQRDIVIDA